MLPIPLPTTGLVKALAILFVAMAVFCAGWQVNGWRLNSKHAEAIAERDVTINDLSSKITTQNHAIDILAERKADADERRKLAEKYSAQLVNTNNRLQAVVVNSKAADCDGLLRETWGAWK